MSVAVPPSVSALPSGIAPSPAPRLRDRLRAADDGVLMRGAFFALLAAAAVFLVVDLREISTRTDAVVPLDPLVPQTSPVLPPALTEGVPQQAPGTIRTAPETLKTAIRFDLQPGGVLVAQGSIDVGAATRFAAEIEARGEYASVVSLDSPGGSVDDALAMSALIRERKLATRVAAGALCASSCPLVLAGGSERQAEDGAIIGVHQVYRASAEPVSADQAMANAQAVTARVGRHLDAMGIAPGLWLHALETPPDRLYYLNADEMRDFALVTAPAAAIGQAEN